MCLVLLCVTYSYLETGLVFVIQINVTDNLVLRWCNKIYGKIIVLKSREEGFFNYPPSSGIASCVRTAGTVMWCLHLTRPCCVALRRVLIWVVSPDLVRSFTKREHSLIFSSLKKSSFFRSMILLNFPIRWHLNILNLFNISMINGLLDVPHSMLLSRLYFYSSKFIYLNMKRTQ